MKQTNHEIVISSCDDLSSMSMMIDDEDVDDEAPLRLWKKAIADIEYDYVCMRLDEFIQLIAIGLNWKAGETVKIIMCDDGFISKYYGTVTRKKPKKPDFTYEVKYFN